VGPLSSNERDWQAERDAEILADAERIKLDNSRHRAAKEKAQETVDRFAGVAGTQKAREPNAGTPIKLVKGSGSLLPPELNM